MDIAVNLGLVVIILGLTYAIMSEGLWGAALIFFNVLFASVIAFNFYETLAGLITQNAGSWSYGYADLVSLMLLFLVSLVLLRVTTDSLGPTMIRFPLPVYHAGRILFGLGAATIATAFMMVAFHTAPVHKKIFGVVGHDTKPPFGLGLDHRFLAFFQYTSGYPFSTYDETAYDPFGEFLNKRVFDPEGRWLIDHEDARPFGEGWREEAGSSPGASPGGAAGAGGDSGLSSSSGNGPGIPGGTAGAAAGLAPTNTGF
ncbi:hypothetical protein [Tautonia sociabilis]|uniref:CvpA family protein n=1 Tax=Tautonia sociabilis TaxID=2080755 RepID=A0A432MQD7_9BACT|nr:hypothetical protein [Tautonia sociabilis]RUL89713.1 hypothetical protein TsocGM_00680 [Tautonia sociabilis]